MLRHYRSKPDKSIRVRAIQWGGSEDIATKIVDQLQQLMDGKFLVGDLSRDGMGNLDFTLRTGGRNTLVQPGNWIVFFDPDDIQVVSSEYFDSMFTMVNWEHDRESDLWPETKPKLTRGEL